MVKLMGILNLTPDSYYEPSRYDMSIFDSGADIIDIGACSTRPGSIPVSEEEEWSRLEPVLRLVRERYPSTTISIDSFRSGIVRRALEILDSFIVNDISSGNADPEMLPLVAGKGLKYIAMHNGGSLIGSDSGVEGDIVGDEKSFFKRFAGKAEKLGIDWILDPGFGFGKTLDQNWELLHRLDELKDFGREILVSISRKRMISERFNVETESEECLIQTERALVEAVERGASILRVHDAVYFKAKFDF